MSHLSCFIVILNVCFSFDRCVCITATSGNPSRTRKPPRIQSQHPLLPVTRSWPRRRSWLEKFSNSSKWNGEWSVRRLLNVVFILVYWTKSNWTDGDRKKLDYIWYVKSVTVSCERGKISDCTLILVWKRWYDHMLWTVYCYLKPFLKAFHLIVTCLSVSGLNSSRTNVVLK